MIREKSEGIVLGSKEYRDRQRLITLLTPHSGLLKLIVKGISKKTPHLLSITTPFCQGEFLYIKGRSDLYILEEGECLDLHLLLRDQLHHLQAACAFAQAILTSQLFGKPSPALYALLSSYLKHLPLFPDPSALIASFYLKLLKCEGLMTLSSASLPPSFSQTEKTLLLTLLKTRQFRELLQFPLSREILFKIKTYFQEQMQ